MRVVKHFIAWLMHLVIWFRYRLRVKGLDRLYPKKGGTLFLPNHPAVFIDPIAVTLSLWPKYPIRPLVVEYMYYDPGIHWMMKIIDALPIPNFSTSSNSLKKAKGEKAIETMIEGLRKGDNFLIYPAGKIKLSSYEAIGGASGVYDVLRQVPDINVVLVRTKGLWGSQFSRAITGQTPQMFSVVFWGIKQILKNLLFFTPRRDVALEFEDAPADFPRQGTKIEINRWLEKWYNKPDGLTTQEGEYPGDSLMLVSSSIWGQVLPKITTPSPEKSAVAMEKIPADIQKKVSKKLAELSDVEQASVLPTMSIATDLGLDSLDIAEVAAYLHDEFDLPGVPVSEITTVGRVMGIAAKQVSWKEQPEEEIHDLTKWRKSIPHIRAAIPEGKTLPEVFLRNCEKMGGRAACADGRSGVLTYNQVRLRAMLLADHLRQYKGDDIGILLPASVAANICVMACHLAGKVPVMINWTVGTRHLESVIATTKLTTIISSWAFIDRLENVDLGVIEPNLVLLEDLRQEFGMKEKIKSWWLSRKSPEVILKALSDKPLTADSTAVVLFTSGTENMPKGVPLSHENILSNQRAALSELEIYQDDILFGILPPFHSFGFTVGGMLGLMAGIRIAFSPNPTDSKRLAKEFPLWGATIFCGAPTFIKGLVKASMGGQLGTLRLCVTGAEKAPPELFEMMSQIGKRDCLFEGYGITECSPVISFNVPGRPSKGVGQPFPGIDVKIVNPATYESLPIGEIGLILVNGPNVFKGYLNPGIESPFLSLEGKNWYKTGDLGNLDEKRYLTISGRLKRFVKIGGEMVSLGAIETALLQAAPEKKWPISQEGPTLAICAKEVEGDRPRITLFSHFVTSVDEVNKTLKESGFSNLVKVSDTQQLTDIPMMGTGKVNYRELESKYLKDV